MKSNLSVKDVEGPWLGDSPTGLTQRCKDYWDTPINELSDLMLSTYLNQNIAIKSVLLEAENRINTGKLDDTELYDGQLLESIERIKQNVEN